MEIGSVTSMNSMSNIQMTRPGTTDTKSKNIKNEITGVRQQMQKLSSKENLSVNEKAKERRDLQKEISGLNTELKLHQEELSKSQKREMKMAELREEQKPTKEEKPADKAQADETAQNRTDGKNPPSDKQQPDRPGTVITRDSGGTVILKEIKNQNGTRSGNIGINVAQESSPARADDKIPADDKTSAAGEAKKDSKAEDDTKSASTAQNTGLSSKEMQALISTDAFAEQTARQDTVIARIENNIVILKGEINQDESRSIDTEKKQEELEQLEKKERRAMSFQFTVSRDPNHTMKSAAKAKAKTSATANVSEEAGKTKAQTENIVFMNAIKISRGEDPASQQRFFVSLEH